MIIVQSFFPHKNCNVLMLNLYICIIFFWVFINFLSFCQKWMSGYLIKFDEDITLWVIRNQSIKFKFYYQMRSSKGFSNQITKVNTTFCSKKTELYVYEKMYYFAFKNMKILLNYSAFSRNSHFLFILIFWLFFLL